jgi:hypothetical protein
MVRKYDFSGTYARDLPPEPPLPPAGLGEDRPDSTFVSKYYEVDSGQMEDFLMRKHLDFRETTTHFLVRGEPPPLSSATTHVRVCVVMSWKGAAAVARVARL